jgi:hypothetical protein
MSVQAVSLPKEVCCFEGGQELAETQRIRAKGTKILASRALDTVTKQALNFVPYNFQVFN